jgi:transposase-like protein
MRPLKIADSATMILGLQDEIRRSEESRYDHRLHGVLLVAQGMTCPEVARLLGDAPRTVEYWVRGFEQAGLAGLREGERGGRPRRLSEKQLQQINAALRQMPRALGLGAICGTAKPWPPGLIGSMGLAWECVNVSACSGSWVSACANRAQRLPGPTRNGSRPIKKTPSVDGRSEGRPVGHR